MFWKEVGCEGRVKRVAGENVRGSAEVRARFIENASV